MPDTIKVELSSGPAGACDHIVGYDEAQPEGLVRASDSLDTAFEFCPLCGVPLDEDVETESSETMAIPRAWLHVVLAVALVMFLLGVVLGHHSSAADKPSAKPTLLQRTRPSQPTQEAI